jgi:hypothetical protein
MLRQAPRFGAAKCREVGSPASNFAPSNRGERFRLCRVGARAPHHVLELPVMALLDLVVRRASPELADRAQR